MRPLVILVTMEAQVPQEQWDALTRAFAHVMEHRPDYCSVQRRLDMGSMLMSTKGGAHDDRDDFTHDVT